MKKIRLVLVDNHQVIIEGLRFLISHEPDIVIEGEASNSQEALGKIPVLQPDIVITDLSMPEMNGIELTEVVRERFPNVHVLILSRHEEEAYVKKAIGAGATGYLSKNISKEELVQAIREVGKGNLYFHTRIAQIITTELAVGIIKGTGQSAEKKNLTKRELEILKLIVDGYNSAQIGTKLLISKNTAENHRTNIMRKLGVNNTAGLVKFALKNNLIDDDGPN
ncbi:response regulator transcription factor [Fulvivirgaceae bacterium BMA12]|uniref:Response regulator transcription factor n=1 Tax=Agaribacillus aureus TaxID=3051825 RepID=A0ABT8L1C9_9BACT|nr:response regulator transcription factor [Fulvivirgaceae bacterium BMA12]